jgi:hypothetical protein
MELEITRTTPVYRHSEASGVFVQWIIKNPTGDIENVRIERSGAPEGPFETVIDNITGFHFFDDLRHVPVPSATDIRENLNFLSLHRRVYYRVTATINGQNVSAIRDNRDNLPLKLAALRRKMQRDIRVGFKFSGVPFAVLKRKHWGIRCKECFDPITKRVTKSKCTSCYGTGFEGGYFDPVRITGRIGVDNVQTQIENHGKVDINQKHLTILDYPILEEADIVINLRQNDRYLVRGITQTELQTVPVHQRAILSELERDSIEYRFPINKDHIPIIY